MNPEFARLGLAECRECGRILRRRHLTGSRCRDRTDCILSRQLKWRRETYGDAALTLLEVQNVRWDHAGRDAGVLPVLAEADEEPEAEPAVDPPEAPVVTNESHQWVVKTNGPDPAQWEPYARHRAVQPGLELELDL